MNSLDLNTNWSKIQRHFNRSFASNFHVSIASVDKDGRPINTPIGSLFLNRDQTGLYFEKYPTKLPKYAKEKPEVCILAVNSGVVFWLKGLLKKRFDVYPGVRLYGVLGDTRAPTEIDTKRLNNRMRTTRWLKGNSYLWGDMQTIRVVTFTKGEMIQLGNMTKNLS
jgi:hypothetical protein